MSKIHPHDMVKEFHTRFEMTVAEKLRDLSEIPVGEWQFRYDLIEEEFEEFKLAFENYNVIEMLDGLGDMIYVIYGMAIQFGWPINEVLAEIHHSNMTKLDADGKPIKREDGKVLKGPNYQAPDIERIWKFTKGEVIYNKIGKDFNEDSSD